MNKIITAVILIIFFSDAGYACRYTVREIGFADFGQNSYQFVLFKDNRVSEADVKLFKNISNAALTDANITVKVIDVLNDQSSVLLQYYKKTNDGKLPNILLVSPEGRAKIFMFDKSENFMQTIWSILENVVASSARNKLTNKIVKSFAVVYLIEGSSEIENTKTFNLVTRAIEEIKTIMSSFPKPVKNPPVVIKIKANEIDNEDVLLWSLGWEKADVSKPAIALMYGRGRRMGPILKGDNIKEDIIRNMLRFIGEDCECGLDRSWMLGTMIPLRWDSKLQAAILTHHGFDADNPMIISEMSQILSIAPKRVNNSVDTDLLYGYSESVLKVSKTTAVNNVKQTQFNSNEFSYEINKTLSFILFGFVGIFIIGGIIFIRAKRRNS